MYYLYILQCADGTLYTGITLDLKRRAREHNATKLGSKYTRGRRPVTLVYFNEYPTRSMAAREEALIKKLSRQEKLNLIENKKLP